MDKYDIVLDLIEHPAEYSPERIAEILSDHEAREVYNLLCKTASAFASTDDKADVDVEWLMFSRCHEKREFRFLWLGGRAASIAAIAFISITAVAIGIAVTVKTFEFTKRVTETVENQSVENVVSIPQSIAKDSMEIAEGLVESNLTVLFEDASLEEILSRVAEVHGVRVEYKKPETAQLHLYYRFDPIIPLKETVEQLNTFEQINIRISGRKLIVD